MKAALMTLALVLGLLAVASLVGTVALLLSAHFIPSIISAFISIFSIWGFIALLIHLSDII